MAQANHSTPIKALLEPWHTAVDNPKKAQLAVLQRLLNNYAQNSYGSQHNAQAINTISEYREAFPIAGYEEYLHLIKKVMGGDTQALLNEEPVGWAITRGTTKGESKFIPMTSTDLKMRSSAGRAMLNYVVETGQTELVSGVNLNLNFPSVVGTVKTGSKEISYGYSSGIYTKYVSEKTPIRSLPTQVDIDSLGGGKTLRDWEARFGLAYESCKEQNVTLVGGVATTALQFGRYLRRNHNVYPKDIWEIKILTLGSVPGINTYLAPALKALYGPAEIREIYGATEGIFGQQRDDHRAWVPNYDLFFFEVETRSGVQMLHELRPGEQGKLIVSTPIFPRYAIGDLIRAYKAPYYRCIGRDAWWTSLKYIWDELRTF